MHRKLQELANEAEAIHVDIDVVILFSVNTDSGDPDIYDCVEADGFKACYENWAEGYDAAELDYKERLNVIGYQYFKYSKAKKQFPYEE